MPMFYTPKPRQFHYKPWFYDPEREEWEKLKTKYRLENNLPIDDNALRAAGDETQNTEGDADLEYFQRRVRDIEQKERKQQQKLTIQDFFRKREKPQFHYVSRFDSEGNIVDTPAKQTKDATVKRRITRRFDNDEDFDRFKPVPAGKIMIYTLLVCILLFFIFS